MNAVPQRRLGSRRERRGNYSLIIGITIPLTFGFAALGLDLAYLTLARTQAQAISDAASHAAFVVYRDSLDPDLALDAATYIVNNNNVGDRPPTLESVILGGWDPSDASFSVDYDWTNAAFVEVSRAGQNKLEPLIARVIGWTGWSIYSSAVTAGQTREVMIAQDITGSFADEDMDNARIADLAFLDYMISSPYPNDKVGMSTFVGGVEDDAWDPLDPLEGNEVATRALWETLDSCNCNEPAYEPICQAIHSPSEWAGYGACWEWFCDDGYHNVNEQPHMQDCFDFGAETAPGAGIDQSIDELLASGVPTSFQAIVLVSDGAPCCGDVLTAEREADAVAAADRAWENGIHVWTVGFDAGDTGNLVFLESLQRGMGESYVTPDSDELAAIMIEIATAMPVTLVQ